MLDDGGAAAVRARARERVVSGIEPECREDVVYKLIRAMRAPDPSTIATLASNDRDAGYEQIVRELVEEAEETDRWDDDLFGAIVAMSCPSIRTGQGRRAPESERRAWRCPRH